MILTGLTTGWERSRGVGWMIDVSEVGQISLEAYTYNKIPPPKALKFIIYHCALCGINLQYSVTSRESSDITVIRCKNGHENRVD